MTTDRSAIPSERALQDTHMVFNIEKNLGLDIKTVTEAASVV
jgi:hypothetical protein